MTVRVKAENFDEDAFSLSSHQIVSYFKRDVSSVLLLKLILPEGPESRFALT